ncbi:MAG: ribbon-helix-helix protein, CopG family [Acidimicrobiaceae bacterium]
MNRNVDETRVATRYQLDTITHMAMTLRLSEKEQRALKKRAERDGVSMQDAARRAIREYLDNSEHTTRVIDAAKQIMKVHAEAIEQLGD